MYSLKPSGGKLKFLIFIYFLFTAQLFLVGTALSQPYFSKAIDLGYHSNERIKKFVIVNDTIYASTGQVCEQGDCSSLVKLDLSGNLIAHRLFSWLDGGDQEYLISTNNQIIMSGHTGILENTRYLLQISSPNLDSLYANSYGLSEPAYRLANRSIVRYSNYYVIMGFTKPVNEDDVGHSHLFWINSETLTLDTIVDVVLGDEFTAIYEAEIDADGFLNSLFLYDDKATIGLHRGVLVMNEAMEIVARVDAPFQNTNSIVENMLLLDSNTYVISEHGLNSYQLLFLDKDGNHINTYTFTTTGYDRRVPVELIRASNGDILGCGLYSSTLTDTLECCIGTGYVFRMTPGGELLWERIILELDSNNMYKYGTFTDIMELSNGDILLGGNIQEENIPGSDEDMWLVRTNSAGCISSNCDFIEIISSTTSSGKSNSTNHVSVFPNPSKEFLNIRVNENNHYDYHLELLDSFGHKIQDYRIPGFENSTTIDIRNLPQGIYWLRTIFRDKSLQTFKCVKA